MNRREFVFGSLTAAGLFSSLLTSRKASAQTTARPRRAFFCVFSAGYPDGDAFFPVVGTEDNWQLSPILQSCAAVKENMVVVDGVNIRDSGFNAAGANHARAPGKVLTAKDVVDDGEEGVCGDVSIDQFLVQRLGLTSLELHLTNDYGRSIREKPFASGPGVFKPGIIGPAEAWDKAFAGFTSPGDQGPARDALIRRLSARRSLLDGVGRDLKRLRAELTGVEKVKLDVHEDSIRRAELSVAKDLGDVPPPAARCEPGSRPVNDRSIYNRARAHLDVMYAAFACDRAQVGGIVWGGSGFGGVGWEYDWAGQQVTDLHNDVHHQAGPMRNTYIACSGWDWGQLGGLVKRLRDTPEGDGNMLDHSIVVGISHFSHHHDIRRIPVVLFGTERSGFRPNRVLRQPVTVNNDRVFVSVARAMGVPIDGFGDEQSCGPLPLL